MSQAQEVLDYQAIGMRCREALLAFVDAAQTLVPWTSADQKPKRADLRAWADHICSVTMVGESHKERRHLFKTLLESAWTFTNWLTHSKGSKWHDAEAAARRLKIQSVCARHPLSGTCAECLKPVRLAAHTVCRPSEASVRTFPVWNGKGPLVTSALDRRARTDSQGSRTSRTQR